MPTFERITTQYIDFEDRIRLAGEVGNAAPVVIWLTRRLLQRLLPALLQWLERQGADKQRAEVLQSFAQQAARLSPHGKVLVGVGTLADPPHEARQCDGAPLPNSLRLHVQESTRHELLAGSGGQA